MEPDPHDGEAPADRPLHRYATSLRWAGTTSVGYAAYDRSHRVEAAPAEASLALSGDPAFGGDARRLNPEQLVVAAASSCQLLSFLAVAARARLDVVAYEDAATAVMPDGPAPMSITRIDLAPVVTLADTGRDRPSPERLTHLTDVAHRECFIANSLRTEVVVTPTFRWSEPR